MNPSPFRDQLVNELAAMGYAIDDVHKAETFTPPQGVQVAALRALKLIADGHAGDGFTDVGRKRASDLAAGRSVSLDTVKRMHSYFARHAVDKQGKDWDNTEKPSPGKVAWLAWGGDAGKTWADAIVRRQENIEKAYKRKYGSRIEAARVAARARWGNRSKTEQPVSSKTNKPDESRAGFVEGRDLTQDPDAMKRLEETFDAIDAQLRAQAESEGKKSWEVYDQKNNLYIEAVMKEQGWFQPMRSLDELPATHESAKRDVGKAEAKAYKNGEAIMPIGGGLYGNGIYISTLGDEGAGRPSADKTLKLGIDRKARLEAKPYAHTIFSEDPDEGPGREFIDGKKAGFFMGSREISANLHAMMMGYSVVEVDGWGEKKRAPSNYDWKTDKTPPFTKENRGFPFGKGPGFGGYVVMNPTAIVYLGVEK